MLNVKFKNIYLRVSVLLFLFVCLNLFAQENVIENNSWEKFFTSNDVRGTIALKKLNTDTIQVFNKERSFKQFIPASTFKIPNSLIALETEVIRDEKEIIKWDRKIRSYNFWNRDHHLSSAIKYSCVWFYQELARRIGKEKMQNFLDKISYGNSQIGSNVDDFWLIGDIRISAIQQIEFLERFLKNKLPFKKRNLKIVEKIMIQDSTESYTIHAKTGWSNLPQKEIGWYVGFVKKKQGTWIFALNIDLVDAKKLGLRKEIVLDILKEKKIVE